MAHARLKALLATGAFAATVFFGLTQPAFPVHEIGLFELDGNVADAAGGGTDWATVNDPTLGLFGDQIAKSGLIKDPAPKTIFTGGGSKDDLDLTGPLSGAGGWKHKDGSVPDKDDITNAYAVAYKKLNAQNKPELVIYAGADRLDNSGDAFIGFWFFQDKVGLGPIQGNAGPFIGQHKVGDTLVLANFTGGGTTVTIEVLEWVGNGGNVNGTLQRVFSSNTARCVVPPDPSGPADDVCAITNPAPGGEVPPDYWPYVAKGKTRADGFPTATFFELGINVTKILGFTPCFSSFMAETRSSSSVSAVLKDFALGDLNVCGIDVTKVCSSGQATASFTSIDYSFSGKITNTGFGELTGIVLEDTPQATTPPATMIGQPAYYECNAAGGPDLTKPASSSPLAAQASVCYAWKFNTNLNESTNSIKVTANASATQTVFDTFGPVQCPKVIFEKGITANKDCTASLVPYNSALAVEIDITGSVCNTGEVQLTNVTVTDKDEAGNALPDLVTNGVLGPKSSANECIFFNNQKYKPTAPDAGTQTQFTDKIVASGNFSALGQTGTVTTAPVVIKATCNLCPTGQCLQSGTTTINSVLRKK